jgi:Leucine rich repeat
MTVTLTFAINIDMVCDYRNEEVNFYKSLARDDPDYFIPFYKCAPHNLQITDEDTHVVTASGDHFGGKTNNDVTKFDASWSTMNFIPDGIGQLLPNIESLELTSCKLFVLTQDDLKQFPKLKYLNIYNNKVEYLENNLFSLNPNIEWLRLWQNELKHIEMNAFVGLHNLKYLDMDKNDCISQVADSSDKVWAVANQAITACHDESVAEKYRPEPNEVEEEGGSRRKRIWGRVKNFFSG